MKAKVAKNELPHEFVLSKNTPVSIRSKSEDERFGLFARLAAGQAGNNGHNLPASYSIMVTASLGKALAEAHKNNPKAQVHGKTPGEWVLLAKQFFESLAGKIGAFQLSQIEEKMGEIEKMFGIVPRFGRS